LGVERWTLILISPNYQSVENRITTCFTRLRSEKRTGFIPYICAGDPTLEETVALVRALEDAGADLVELGIPFSDPLADGIVNQLAAQRALNAGATVRGVLNCVRNIRQKSDIPIVLYTYLNPVLQFGFDKFHRQAQSAGIDGLLILDLPPEEDPSLAKLDRLKRSSLKAQSTEEAREGIGGSNLLHIRLIAPTTTVERIQTIVKRARGFLYYVSREGVTGARETIASSLGEKVAQLRKLSDLPIAVGFGVSNADQAGEVARHADAVVVGSAIVHLIAKYGSGPELLEKVGALARDLANAVH
jgi:tryptophan synthase alpha chain